MIWDISGCEVLIDDEDYERLKDFSYSVDLYTFGKTGSHYFRRSIYINGRRTTISLHRDIMLCILYDRNIVDHINCNTLDCRKANLRICTRGGNNRNVKTRKDNTSNVKGVDGHKASNKWRARINLNGVSHCLGYFKDIKDAEAAYAKASKEFHGEFGRTK